MDLVHGPPHGPGPWTQSMDNPMDHPNIQKEIASVNMKIHQRSGYEKHRLLFIAYVLEGLSRNSGLLWDRAPHKLKTHKLVLRCIFAPNIFIPTIPNCNSNWNTLPPPSRIQYSCIKISRLILQTKFTPQTQICNQGILMKKV